MYDWDADIPAADREKLLDRIAHEVVKRRLETPTILFLEMNRPLAGIAGQGIIFSAGMLAPIFGLNNVQRVSKLLREPGGVDALLDRIEALSKSDANPEVKH